MDKQSKRKRIKTLSALMKFKQDLSCTSYHLVSQNESTLLRNSVKICRRAKYRPLNQKIVISLGHDSTKFRDIMLTMLCRKRKWPGNA